MERQFPGMGVRDNSQVEASRMKQSGISLKVKGFILVALPLCLLLCFGSVLTTMEEEAEKEARNAVLARNISNQVANLQMDIMRVLDVMNRSSAEQFSVIGYKGVMTPQFRSVVRDIKKRYNDLDRLTADNAKLNTVVKHSLATITAADDMLQEITCEIQHGDVMEVIQRLRNTNAFDKIVSNFRSQELMLIAQAEEDFAEKSNERQAAIRRRIFSYSFIVIIIEGVLSVFMTIFLFRTIALRLDLMAENAVRLTKNEPLHPPLKGSDEIANLDHVFHDMAKKIDESAQAKQELFNMVTHDIRNPVTAIQGCLEMLDRDSGKESASERTQRLIKVSVRNCSRAMGLINDLLDSQKIQAGSMTLEAELLDLEDVFREIELNLSDWIKEYSMMLTFDANEQCVKANPDLLSRIIFNLISNAIKYSPKDGTISVKAYRMGEMVEITVTDEGPGVPEHMQKTIFERFQQVDKSDRKRGSGLGLTICQDFVALHGGEIWVTSVEGRGSTFHFTVPMA